MAAPSAGERASECEHGAAIAAAGAESTVVPINVASPPPPLSPAYRLVPGKVWPVLLSTAAVLLLDTGYQYPMHSRLYWLL